MIACSLSKEGRALPAKARVWVVLDALTARQTIRYCHQCRNAPCAEACPTEAIRKADAGYWVIDEALCTRCGACVTVCPFEAIGLARSGMPIKCDTCAGEPQCVASCPSEALTWVVRR